MDVLPDRGLRDYFLGSGSRLYLSTSRVISCEGLEGRQETPVGPRDSGAYRGIPVFDGLRRSRFRGLDGLGFLVDPANDFWCCLSLRDLFLPVQIFTRPTKRPLYPFVPPIQNRVSTRG